jgi:osomolarity two-component system sensor histidine kinase SLN1
MSPEKAIRPEHRAAGGYEAVTSTVGFCMPLWSRPPSSSKCAEELAMPTLPNGDSTSVTTTSPITPQGLPLPVLHSVPSGSIHRKQKKSARFGVLQVHWGKIKKRIGPATAPSTTSLSGSNGGCNQTRGPQRDLQEDNEEVDEVVLDRVWSDELKSSVASNHGVSPDKSGSHQPVCPKLLPPKNSSLHFFQRGTSLDHESVGEKVEGFWAMWTPLIILRWRIWPAIMKFFSSSFHNKESEAQYAKENWHIRKVCYTAALYKSVNVVPSHLRFGPRYLLF